MYMMLMRSQMKSRKIITVFCIILLLFLASCNHSKVLNTNTSMQEMLDEREGGLPQYFPPDNDLTDCIYEHRPKWYNIGIAHYQLCSKCGKVLLEEEEHEPYIERAEKCVIVNDRLYIVIERLCKCLVLIEEEYKPLEIDESESGK